MSNLDNLHIFLGAPDKPEDIELLSYGEDWVLIGWRDGFDGGDSRVRFEVQIQEQENHCQPHFTISQNALRLCETNICNITHLQQMTPYSIKVRVNTEKSNPRDARVRGFPICCNYICTPKSRILVSSRIQRFKASK